MGTRFLSELEVGDSLGVNISGTFFFSAPVKVIYSNGLLELSGVFEALSATFPTQFIVSKPSMRLSGDDSAAMFAVGGGAGRVAIGSDIGSADDMLVITSAAAHKPGEANIVMRTREAAHADAVDTVRIRSSHAGGLAFETHDGRSWNENVRILRNGRIGIGKAVRWYLFTQLLNAICRATWPY